MDSFVLVCKNGLESVPIMVHNGTCYEELVRMVCAKWPILNNLDVSFSYSIPGHDHVLLSNQEGFSCMPILVSVYGLKVVELNVSTQSSEKDKIVEMNVSAQSSDECKVVQMAVSAQSSEKGKIVEMKVSAQSSDECKVVQMAVSAQSSEKGKIVEMKVSAQSSDECKVVQMAVSAQSSEKGKVVEMNISAQTSDEGKVVEKDVSAQSSEKGVSLSEFDRYHGTNMGKAKKAKVVRTSEDVTEIHECEDPKNEEIGLCITDLPSSISIVILSSLPLNCMLICRCVCKTWRNLIKDSEFVKLHFTRAEAYPLIRPIAPTYVSRILYFVDQPPKCEGYLNMKLGTKLKIPLRNAELVMNGEEEASTKLPLKQKTNTKVRPKVHKLNVVNSCNGFLCLSEPFHNGPVMVCNPITGEFIKLPIPTKSWEPKPTKRWEYKQEFIDCGLCCCPKTNQYKVVRMFNQETREMTIEPVTGSSGWCSRVAEIHTLGTNTWKMIGYAPSLPESGKPTYLNGTLNWLHLSSHKSPDPYYIASFDIGEEKFQSIPIPPKRYGEFSYRAKSKIWIGELRGCLCVSDASDDGFKTIELWVMKTYGVESSWKIEIKIDISSLDPRLFFGSYEPMGYFKDGTLLFFHYLSSSVFCYDPDNKKLRVLKVYGRQYSFEAISYIPSFISLKDAMIGDDVEVYYVKSGCGDLKFLEETSAVSLVDWASGVYTSDVSWYED